MANKDYQYLFIPDYAQQNFRWGRGARPLTGKPCPLVPHILRTALGHAKEYFASHLAVVLVIQSICVSLTVCPSMNRLLN